MPRTNDRSALWLWPWTMAQANRARLETMVAAPTVVAARMPAISAAMQNPLNADLHELTRMVTEKADAFGQSQRSLTSASQRFQAASEGNARDLGKLSGGGIFDPAIYMRIFERNVSAAAALLSLPGEAIAPIHKKATRNARRLRS